MICLKGLSVWTSIAFPKVNNNFKFNQLIAFESTLAQNDDINWKQSEEYKRDLVFVSKCIIN